MTRSVSAQIRLQIHGDVDLIFSVAAATDGQDVDEHLTVVGDRGPIDEVAGRNGTRLHRVSARRGPLTLDYAATVGDRSDAPAIDDFDLIEYGRPSRYCESDALFSLARQQFAGLSGSAAIDAVEEWVSGYLTYVPGSSSVTDGARATHELRKGVCRDFAHLVIAFLRALDVPARLVSMYAPGLVPMDFHAVAEAYADGVWRIVDATGLAPVDTMVRIATGRDAADTAFLTQHGGAVDLVGLDVDASMAG